jgi:hypothetical protein
VVAEVEIDCRIGGMVFFTLCCTSRSKAVHLMKRKMKVKKKGKTTTTTTTFSSLPPLTLHLLI